MFYFDEGLQRLLGELWGATKNAVRVVLVGDRPGHVGGGGIIGLCKCVFVGDFIEGFLGEVL